MVVSPSKQVLVPSSHGLLPSYGLLSCYPPEDIPQTFFTRSCNNNLGQPSNAQPSSCLTTFINTRPFAHLPLSNSQILSVFQITSRGFTHSEGILQFARCQYVLDQSTQSLPKLTPSSGARTSLSCLLGKRSNSVADPWQALPSVWYRSQLRLSLS